MSTNYYLNDPKGASIHIGKSSIGWQFLFNVGNRYSDDPINSFDSWMDYLDLKTRSGHIIVDEYGRPYELKELRKLIIEKQKDGMNYWSQLAREMLPRVLDKSDKGDSGERYCPKGFRFSTSSDFS